MHARSGWSQPPTGWPQPSLPGWAPLIYNGPLPFQAARSLVRWLWPTLAVSGFVAVVAYTLAHDDPAPGLLHRGLLTLGLAAAVVVMLTLHRRYGPGSLARALAEYTVVAVLAGLLAAAGAAADQPTADNVTPATASQPNAQPDSSPKAEAAADQDRPAVLQVAAKAIRAITGAVGWLVDLWHQASEKAEPAKGQAMAARLLSPPPARASCWRCP